MKITAHPPSKNHSGASARSFGRSQTIRTETMVANTTPNNSASRLIGSLFFMGKISFYGWVANFWGYVNA